MSRKIDSRNLQLITTQARLGRLAPVLPVPSLVSSGKATNQQ